MKRLLLICLATAASSTAQAHDSVVPHTHPHGVSVLPDLYAMLAAAAVIAVGVLVVRLFKRG